ncbi:hypothetical protein RR46_03802 [Papilio xuthus]|uniref:FLYWCH-type domain-containing protein n=1 Tax=Papilio xuthus TaxID=66420 RepID=A0A194Q1I0_PAPXU|nr:hypothetical protein RR46_03802 [Papilio xuthus]
MFINTRGNSKLFIYQNHTFRFMYKRAYGSQLWYCWYFFSRCCPAKLRIDNSGKVTESIGRHNHDPPTCWMTPDGKSYSEDLVQCVPTRKGHHILFKGYTYTFKSRLQCGAEQWCCSYRQKTGCISMINMQAYGVEVLRDFHNHKKPMFSDGF